MTGATPGAALPDGLWLRLKVHAGARRDAIAGLVLTVEGPALRVAVVAPPADGRANAAILGLLAATFALRPRAVTLLAGAGSRLKRVKLTGDSERLLRRLAEVVGGA